MSDSSFWILRQFWNQSFFIPKSKFDPEDIPDLSGKVIIVTGGNTGIGKETIKALLKKNAKVYMASRNRQRAESAIADLKSETGREAVFLELDLSDLASVKRSAESFQKSESQLHVLFNNGGVMQPPIDQVTKQGYDLQFGTNVIGHFYFTKLLLPTILSTARSSPAGTVRIVNTGSASSFMYPKPNVDYDTMKDLETRKKAGRQFLYHQSKFGNVLFANELARRYGDEGVVTTSLNPGNILTELGRTVTSLGIKIAIKILCFPTPYGALTQLYAGTMPEAKDLNGKFLFPWARVGKCSTATENPEVAAELWDWLEKQVAEWEAKQV